MTFLQSIYDNKSRPIPILLKSLRSLREICLKGVYFVFVLFFFNINHTCRLVLV